ncbi:YopX family protein [Lactiplantibacillus plantarum]|uniref:YopX family protein n=1 Tax=Lactiplantibacillus plantarum TaxID=1590 RepID=UPI000B143CAE|nr:YopX family protein [Lactiplantibacillus plantarum]UQK33362.1 YopX family protein [Lactiplantibacillus plantarum]
MIKFRAWNQIDSEYINEINAVMGLDGSHIWWDINDSGEMKYEDDQDNYKLEQFTGLKDVNGKEIYEGDIIKSSYKYAQPKVSQIIIEDGNSYILGEDLATGNEMLVSDHISEIKVIGNVHENPELLKEDK